MQVTMDKVKTTAFVLKNRLMGYKLLQNPKGTNPNEVTMLKTWFGLPFGGLWGECVDKCYHYHRIHRYQAGDKFVQDKTFLMTEYFMDPETKTYPSKRKNYTGYMVKNGIYKSLDKEVITQYESDKRAIPDWQLDNFDLPKERYEFEENLFRQNKKPGHYIPRTWLLDRILSFCKIIGERPVKPSFWHVLKTNLNGGGVA
jgi:hypothetical protein